MNPHRVLYLIPARGGSKGIPGKNIKLLDGKPLIHYTIEIARALTSDENICVSTEDVHIKNVVEQTGLELPFIRPEQLAADDSGMYEVLLHALDHYEKNGNYFDLLVLLQPTSPFRKKYQVVEAIGSWQPGLEMVVGAKLTKANPYYLLFEENEKGYLIKSKTGTFRTRQECPAVYEINGAVYVIDVPSLRQRPLTAFERIRKYLMDDVSSLDLDTTLDWKFAEFLLAENKK